MARRRSSSGVAVAVAVRVRVVRGGVAVSGRAAGGRAFPERGRGPAAFVRPLEARRDAGTGDRAYQLWRASRRGRTRGLSAAAKTCYAWRAVRISDVVARTLSARWCVWRAAWAAALAMAAPLAACGRRATDADCKLIVDKSVELQMREMSRDDDAAIAEREKQVRAALGDEIKSCESLRVTDKTMGCVQSAASIKELDTCLR